MPGAPSGVPDAPRDRFAVLLDVTGYAVWLTVAFAAAAAALAVLAGWPAAQGVKYGLFVVGWLAFGFGTFKLLPSRPWKDDDDGGRFETAAGEDTAFQSLVQRLPPARFRPVPVVHRLPTGVRVFLASLVMLGTSLALEQMFGIGP
ncbi:hypothetical protein [Halobacterium sp. CBA1126]|uniref:DUF7555 family protein n=1 Tax=Halobacterium sp. CBA1126 TaxID=2668074 RepID=UPI0012FAD460|nr:hypothetical protein [Halobacterium sp. CBA1126]MUV61643.1 hypothetical protein [Halobacterium sp. CBA1126]